ncbi:MAG: hypothetical protein GY847_37290 [Proteobacteria bacterium]|nr:hypothetical protein [Pseudomonadota bacterium]
MKTSLFLVLTLGALGCISSGIERSGVQSLDLRDPKLPIEARRWLADAEDEVAIARARMDDAWVELTRIKAYRGSLIDRLDDTWSVGKGQAAAEGEKASWAFLKYADQRVELAELEVKISTRALSLTITRLTQARAETAVRYDLAIYEIETIVHEVDLLRNEVATIQSEVENKRAEVERAADEVWDAYVQYVSKGGVTNALWGLP